MAPGNKIIEKEKVYICTKMARNMMESGGKVKKTVRESLQISKANSSKRNGIMIRTSRALLHFDKLGLVFLL